MLSKEEIAALACALLQELLKCRAAIADAQATVPVAVPEADLSWIERLVSTPNDRGRFKLTGLEADILRCCSRFPRIGKEVARFLDRDNDGYLRSRLAALKRAGLLTHTSQGYLAVKDAKPAETAPRLAM